MIDEMKKRVGIIISFLILVFIFIISIEFKILLILLLITLLFISLDYLAYERRSLKEQELNIENDKRSFYHPNLRIWGIGVILGIGGVFFKILSSFREKEFYSVSVNDCWQSVIFKLGLLLFITTVWLRIK